MDSTAIAAIAATVGVVGGKLIAAVEKATGALFEPAKIVRRAEAEAEAKLIHAYTDIQIDDIRQRASRRVLAQEIQKQKNAEEIVYSAAKQVVSEPAEGKAIEEDWLNRFILEAQEVSDERLQAIWSKLLAGEFQSPGKYSRRLFRVIKDLDPGEAQLIDELSAKVLFVEKKDGTLTAFLNSHILREASPLQDTAVRRGPPTENIGQTPVKGGDLLEEIGLLDSDFKFSISAQGLLNDGKGTLSRYSAKRIFSEARELLIEDVQPAFHSFGMGSVVFDAWKLTEVGKQLFGLSQRPKDASHLDEIEAILIEASIRVKTVFPTPSSQTPSA